MEYLAYLVGVMIGFFLGHWYSDRYYQKVLDKHYEEMHPDITGKVKL